MKRVAVCLMSCLFLVAFSSFALAESPENKTGKPDGYYLSFFGGGAFLTDADIMISDESEGSTVTTEYDTGFLAGIAIGYKHDNQRLEGEFSYQKNDFDTVTYMSDKEEAAGDQTAAAFLFNYYFDIPTKYSIKPFLTAGIGAARIDVNDLKTMDDVEVDIDENDTVFAYQFGLGFSWDMSQSLDLELKYRYFGTAEAKFEDADLEFGSHNVILGLRIAL